MKRLLLLAALAVSALAIPMAVAAADDPIVTAYSDTMATSFGETAAATPAGGADVAVGNALGQPTCICSFHPREIHLAGASSIPGATAGGMLRITDATNGNFLQGHVICVTANGNTATVGAIVDRQSGTPTAPGDLIFQTVYDNGRPGDPTPDLFSGFAVGEPASSAVDGQCLTGPYPPLFAVVDGDIMVKDGQL